MYEKPLTRIHIIKNGKNVCTGQNDHLAVRGGYVRIRGCSRGVRIRGCSSARKARERLADLG